MVVLGISLYNPNANSISYIKSIYQEGVELLVFDNSDCDMLPQYACELPESLYFWNGRNYGLSTAFNYMLSRAKGLNANYLLLLDQDSCFDVHSLLDFCREIEHLDDTEVGIVSVRTFPLSERNNIGHVQLPNESERDWVISSGSALNIRAIMSAGITYDENVFLDYVDIDFCEQVRKAGLKIVTLNQYRFVQPLGELKNGKTIHAPFREYYMVRDFLYLKWRGRRSWAVGLGRVLSAISTGVMNCKRALLDRDDAMTRVCYICKGVMDFLFRKTGPVNNPTQF